MGWIYVDTKMRGPSGLELGESKLNLWRFGHFFIPLVETCTIRFEDVLGLGW